MIRVALPAHLRKLVLSGSEVVVEVPEPVTLRAVLDALENDYPVLRGTIRDHVSKARRPFLRYFANGQDVSLESLDTLLPQEVVDGQEPFMIIGAIAGG